MKLVRYAKKGAPESGARAGIVLDGNLIGDLRAGYASYLLTKANDPQGREIAALRFPANLAEHISLGSVGQAALGSAAD